MNENDLNFIVENDREWRKHIFRKLESTENKVDDIDKRVVRLEVRNAFFGSVFGSVFGFIFGIIGAYINK